MTDAESARYRDKEARELRARWHGSSASHEHMAANSPEPANYKPTGSSRRNREGLPTNEELLHELRLHGAKPPPPRETRGMSRRTRDFLLVAGTGSALIGIGVFKLLGETASGNALTLALTGIALFCGLSWFVFYGVMNRY